MLNNNVRNFNLGEKKTVSSSKKRKARSEQGLYAKMNNFTGNEL